ncbi:hypothetical protein TL16_g01114, partial [Triparma laevis f. inornata]
MEFVPGVGLAPSNPTTQPPAPPQQSTSFGSLSTAAASYTPGQQQYTAAASQQQQQQYAAPAAYAASAQQQQQVPQSTLVSRNGQQFRVPSGLANQYAPAEQAQYDAVVSGIRGGEG